MKDFHPVTLFAIAQEALGVWLYALLVLLALVVALYGIALYRGLPLGGFPLRIAALAGLVAGAAAMLLAPPLTDAGYDMLLTAVDWLLLAAIGLGAFVAVLVGLTPVFALLAGAGGTSRRIAITRP